MSEMEQMNTFGVTYMISKYHNDKTIPYSDQKNWTFGNNSTPNPENLLRNKYNMFVSFIFGKFSRLFDTPESGEFWGK